MSLHLTLYTLLATLLLGGCDQQTAAVASAPAPVGSEDSELYSAKPDAPGMQRGRWRLLVLGGSVPASQAEQSAILRPPGEDAARHIEGRLAKVGNPDGKALSLPAILLGHTVAALDPTDRTPLCTLGATHLGRSFPIRNKKTAELLGVPYPKTTHARFM